MKHNLSNWTVILAGVFVWIGASSPALAYIGPGLGAGALAALLGVIAAVLLFLFSIIYYPIKRMRRRKRQAAQKDTQDDTAAG